MPTMEWLAWYGPPQNSETAAMPSQLQLEFQAIGHNNAGTTCASPKQHVGWTCLKEKQ